MHYLRAVARQPLGVLVGFAGASALFLLVFGLALTSGKTMASHAGGNSVHACVSRYTGQARIMLPGQPPSCSAGEVLIEWASGSAVANLEARLTSLEAQVPDCLSSEDNAAVFEGCNVQIRNGLGKTNSTNGAGNLIIGYNEPGLGYDRGGSHYLVLGFGNGYSSYGGLVAGKNNQATGPYASVSGGNTNTASGESAHVSGGNSNVASGETASVSGGGFNTASGPVTSILGGQGNVTTGIWSTVSGGRDNVAAGNSSSVSGGSDGVAPNLFDWVAGSLFEDF